ncbi:MAG TPA: signal peptidase II [Mucilaginibacter sp.]
MKSNKYLRIFIILFLLALNIGCDQLSKSIVRHKVQYYERYYFFHKYTYITHVENTGAFLGVGDSLTGSARTILLNLLPLIAVLYGLYFILTRRDLDRITLSGLILIVGGGIGNLYDRIVHGLVTDFLFINFGLFQTGIFNIADMSIMAGVFMILVHSFFVKKPEVVENQN